MRRIQILLDEKQHQSMKSLAERERCSVSSLVRVPVTAFLDRRAQTGPTNLAEITGIGSDLETSGRDHDKVLYCPRNDDEFSE